MEEEAINIAPAPVTETSSDADAKQVRPRLKFIDMGRSLAILLMLEGHFTGAALSWEYRDPDQYFLYNVWHLVHGLTSPLFFTVTGVIFVYLLTADMQVSFRENIRVKKGVKRVGQLIFWGYFIQFNLWVFGKSIYYGNGFHFDWFYGFHVLQSIGVGLGIVILIYGLYKLLNFGKIWVYYLIAGVIMFAFYSIMKEHINLDEKLLAEGVRKTPEYWPSGAPRFIQNMFYGEYSEFSFVRMAGYTILGGMLGAIIRMNEHKVKKWWFGVTMIAAGLIISIFIRYVFYYFDEFTEYIGLTEKGLYELNSTSFSRFGQVVVLLGILMLVDKYFKFKAKLFLKVGQNTFPIYVVHVIILYGGILGFGLKPLVFDQNLDPFTSVGISMMAIAFFITMVAYIEPLERLYYKVVYALRLKKRPEKG